MHQSHPPAPPARHRELLRAQGLRVTSGRVAALGYIEQHPHSSVADIYAALEDELPSLSPQSVHNIVHDLTDCGILRRVSLPHSGSALYEAQLEDNHHHVQCIVCHRIEDVPCAEGAAPCLAPSQDHGMRIIEATVTFRGICTDCESAKAHADSAPDTSPAPVPATP